MQTTAWCPPTTPLLNRARPHSPARSAVVSYKDMLILEQEAELMQEIPLQTIKLLSRFSNRNSQMEIFTSKPSSSSHVWWDYYNNSDSHLSNHLCPLEGRRRSREKCCKQFHRKGHKKSSEAGQRVNGDLGSSQEQSANVTQTAICKKHFSSEGPTTDAL